MADPEKPSLRENFRQRLEAARKDRAFLLQRKQKERALQQERTLWEKEQKALEKKLTPSFLDLPGLWLERRRIQKLIQEADRQYAELGELPLPPKTLAGRMGRAARLWFAGITEDRERLWRRMAWTLGAAFALSVAANLALYYHYTPGRPLVTIGNRVIQKREYQADLEAAAGKSVLIKIVFTELIQQAAAKAGVTPTPAQVEARIADLERHGAPIAMGADKQQLRQSVGLTLALENLRIRGVPASDAEIEDFYRKNAAQLAQPARVKSILVVTPTEFEAQTATGLLAKGKTAAEMAAQPNMRVDGENGFHIDLNALPDALHQSILDQALAMRAGQITTLSLGGAFLTIKCLQRDAPDQPPLPEIRDQIARLIKLSKAPSADTEMALLYQANPPKFDVTRYAAYLNDVQHVDPSAPAAVSTPGGAP